MLASILAMSRESPNLQKPQHVYFDHASAKDILQAMLKQEEAKKLS